MKPIAFVAADVITTLLVGCALGLCIGIWALLIRDDIIDEIRSGRP